jgi:Co/Zn/Cd efflux system component
MHKTEFLIKKMDCPSEENIIRMKLDDIADIKKMDFDIATRTLKIYHEGNLDLIKERIFNLNFDSSLVKTEKEEISIDIDDSENQKKLLWFVLAINFGFFIIEMTTGWISRSMGLVADSLDMLADAFVYGLSLIAVGGTIAKKKSIAKMSGYFQMFLAILGFSEVIRRFIGLDIPPDFQTMIIVSILALIANGFCLYLLQKSKSEEAHMKASMIFTSNDVIINSGVILAGVLVNVLNSNKPDLIIGTIVFVIVIRGAINILKLSK